jgi:RNA polymerase sigma factor (sigma-70 family)
MTAYDELYRRHIDGAQRVARIVTGSADEAQDVVSEAFTRVLDRLQHGGGPETELGPYLNTVVRRLAIDRYRASRRDGLPADPTLFDVMPEADDPISRSTDRELVRRAFETLPERWQQVLWHTEIEGRTAAALAPSLGSTPNAVAALAYRAREGLRQAYLSVHLSADIPEQCRPYVPKLAAYVRGTLSPREDQWVAAHVENCPHCRDRRDELMLLVADLRGVLWPALLLPVVFGGAKTAAAAGAAGIAGAGAGAAADGAKGGAAGGAGGGAGGTGAAGVVAGAAGAAGIAAGAAVAGGSAGAAAAGSAAAGGAGAAGAAAAAGWLARIPKPKSLAAQITTATASVAAVSAIIVSAAVIASDDEPPAADDGTVAAPLDPGRVGPPASVPRPSPQPTQSPPAASPSFVVPPVTRPAVLPPAGVDPGPDPTVSVIPTPSSSPPGAGPASPSASSAVPSATRSATPSDTPSPTRPSTPMPSQTEPSTPTPTPTRTETPSSTPTPTETSTPSPTPTRTETSTPTPSQPTVTPTIPPPPDPPPWWWRWFCRIFPWWPGC